MLVQDIKENAWFSDEQTNIIGTITFDEVIFKKDIRVDVINTPKINNYD